MATVALLLQTREVSSSAVLRAKNLEVEADRGRPERRHLGDEALGALSEPQRELLADLREYKKSAYDADQETAKNGCDDKQAIYRSCCSYLDH